MRKSVQVVAWIVATSFLPVLAQQPSVYEKDVQFALRELEARCGHFLKLKGVDWKMVSAQFLIEARAVQNDQEHLVFLVRLLARLRDGHASVRPLERGKHIRWPDDGRGERTGPGMFWCRSGEKILVKNSWSSAQQAGVQPGMEVVKVNGVPVREWLDQRIAKLSDKIGFSTEQHAFFFACHWGLADPKGTRLELELKDLEGGSRRAIVAYTGANPVAWGPAFFPEGIHKGRHIKYGKTARGFGYLHVRRCPGNLPELTDEALAALGDVPGLIVDFRGNSGGGFDHDAFLGRFIPQGKQIAFRKRYRSAGPNPYSGPIVVIVDATARSAGETAAGIFKEDGRAYMIGESPTAGMSSQKTTIELPSRLFSLYVSVRSNKLRFNNGTGIEGIGVIPHETVAYSPTDLANGIDTLIRRAEELLADFPGEKVPYDPSRFGWESAPATAADIPFEEVVVGRDEKMRYFRFGPKTGGEEPGNGYGLLVILPGGSGSADFREYSRSIYKYACEDSYVAVQLVAPEWTPDQETVWPTHTLRTEAMRFSTEEFVRAVIADAEKWQSVDRKRVTVLAWGSSGLAAYATSLDKERPASRFLIAMSVFKPDLLPDLEDARGQSFYLYHSPEDHTCPFRMAEQAEGALEEKGARVTLARYAGGHGWRGNAFEDIRKGLQWLEGAAAEEAKESGSRP